MLLNKITTAEQEELRELVSPYLAQNAEIREKLKTAKGKEKDKLQAQLDALDVQIANTYTAYYQAKEEEEFKQIKGGAKGIISHAKKLLPLIINELTSDLFYVGAHGGAVLLNGGTEDEAIHIKASFALDFIKYHLRLHIKALSDNEEALQDLFLLVNKCIKECDIIDEDRENAPAEDIKPEPQALDTFRRSPLANIEKVGIMSDKLNATMLTDPSGMLEGLLTEEANGQLRLFWSVIQTKKGQEQVAVMASLSLPPGYEGLSRKISGFDLAVYSAVSDIFAKWVKENPLNPLLFTPAEIWRRMNGKQPNDGKAKPSEAKEKKIIASIEKMRHMDFYIQLDEELKAKRITLDDSRLIKGKFTDYFLNCSIVEFTNEKGVNMKGYLISPDKMPILYAYNLAKGNIRSLPFELLDTSDTLSDSDYVTELKFYLLRQIQYMQSQEEKAISDKKSKQRINPDNVILLETLYRGAGIPTPEERAIEWAKSGKTASNEKGEAELKKAIDTQTRKNRSTDKEKIENILNSWISKKWIKGYTAISGKNKTISGYSIKL